MRALLPWVALLLLASACRPPHLLIVVEDPRGLAEDADEIAVGDLAGELHRASLTGADFPLRLTVVAAAPGPRELSVEALSDGALRARGLVAGAFAAEDAATVFVELAVPCEAGDDAACDDGVFCNGVERCDARSRTCAAGGSPCEAPPVACAAMVCVEEDQQCRPTPDHASCGAAEQCDLDEGCVETTLCASDAECADATLCDGEERCVDGRCVDGFPVLVDDGEPCTVDRCDDETGLAVHLALDDGDLCQLSGGEPGLCAVAVCTPSICGDGLVDAARGERCDDGNGSDTDLCDGDCQPRAYRVSPHLGGGRCEGGDLELLQTKFFDDAAPIGADLLLVNRDNELVYRLDTATRVVERVAGNGARAFTPDGTALEGASLDRLQLARALPSGRPLIVEKVGSHRRVRTVDDDGDLNTLVGGGGSPAVDAPVDPRLLELHVLDLTVRGETELFHLDFGRVYQVDLSDLNAPVQRAIIGGGEDPALTPVPSRDFQFFNAASLIALPDGRLVTAHLDDGSGSAHALYVHAEDTAGDWTTVRLAGDGSCDAFVDGGPALTTPLCEPHHLAAGALGDVVCAVVHPQVICLGQDGNLHHRAGAPGDAPVEGDPRLSPLPNILSIAAASDGALFVFGHDTEFQGYAARVPPGGGDLEIWYTPGPQRPDGCGAGVLPATGAALGEPTDLATLPDGRLALVARDVGVFTRASDGILEQHPLGTAPRHLTWVGPHMTGGRDCFVEVAAPGVDDAFVNFAGCGVDPGDGVDGRAAALLDIVDTLALSDTELAVADRADGRVRRLTFDPDDGLNSVVDTLAGTLDPTASTEDGPALETRLQAPVALAMDSLGRLLIAESLPGRVRRLEGGALTTLATHAGEITSLAVDADDNVLFTVRDHRVFFLPAAGGPAQVALGDGALSMGYGLGPSLSIAAPTRVHRGADGELYVASGATRRVVRLDLEAVGPE